MNTEKILRTIPDELPRLHVLDNDALDAWAADAIALFNNPPDVPENEQVEAIGRELARLLLGRMSPWTLQPSSYRIAKAFERALPHAAGTVRAYIPLWSDVVAHYLAEQISRDTTSPQVQQ